MNDLPIPRGDFFEAYAKKNTKHNLVLATGLIFFTYTIWVTKQNIELLSLNFSPPESYD